MKRPKKPRRIGSRRKTSNAKSSPAQKIVVGVLTGTALLFVRHLLSTNE